MPSPANAARQLTPSPEHGTTIDRYELLCHLARGGMADVWLARLHGKPGFEKLFAIKTILPAEADNALFRDMFLDEARLVSRIEHPNVVRVTDAGEEDERPYLVMELIEGEALDKLARDLAKKKERLPLGVALRIVVDACHGLAAAHELRDETGALLDVVHRDVSPQNILVTTAGISKVIDFGIAKARDRTSMKTAFGTLKGKLCYMPPEQARGGEVDARTDTWALGAVLHTLIVGRPPYKAESEIEVFRQLLGGAPIPPLPPSVPEAVRAVVMRALAPEPAERFQSAREMADALEEATHAAGAAVSHHEVGRFVEKAMGSRLGARRRLIAEALTESRTRESVRLEAAIPVEVDLGPEASSAGWEQSSPSLTTGEAAAHSMYRPVQRPEPPARGGGRWRMAAVLGLVAAGALIGARARNAAPESGAHATAAVTTTPALLTAEPSATPAPTSAPASTSAPAALATATARPAAPTARAAPPPGRTAAAVASPPSSPTRNHDDEAGF